MTWVVDANILMDLHAGEILPQLFRLLSPVAGSDLMLAELQKGEPDPVVVVELGLQVRSLDGEQVARVPQLRAAHGSLSATDVSALLLAEVLSATLLTGDGHLRALAEERGCPVHGTLWLLDRLVEEDLLTRADAAEALVRMRAAGARLPDPQCRRRLEEWTRARP